MVTILQFKDDLLSGYQTLTSVIPSQYSALLTVFIFSLIMAVYGLFTLKFYRSLGKKDLLSINLAQYNQVDHPFTKKLFAILLYFVEYIVILPAMIFVWFAILGLVLLMMSEQQGALQVLNISAAIVASIRILAYYDEEIAKEIAKLLPLTLLGILIASPGFFSVSRAFDGLLEVPKFFTNILYFLLFIMALELILRIVDLIFYREDED